MQRERPQNDAVFLIFGFMTRIGLLSDTHSYLDRNIFRHFAHCDEVWHAGDFGSVAIVDELQSFRLLRGVWGNIDEPAIRQMLPEHNRFSCEGLDVWITHIGGYPGKYAPAVKKQILENPPGLFISGHSHILKIMFDESLNCLHINPGAAGIQGWHRVRTAVRFSVDRGKIRDCEVIELGKK